MVLSIVPAGAIPSDEPSGPPADGGGVIHDNGEGKVVWQDGDWVRRTHSERLTDAHQRTMKGRHHGEACLFEFEEILEAGSEEAPTSGVEIVEREIAINETTCEMILEVGKRPAKREKAQALRSDAGEAGVIEAAAASGSRVMWQEMAIVDLPGWKVSWSRSGHSYKWNGTCVTDQYNLTASRGKLTATGWYETLWQTSASGDVCAPYVWRRAKVYHNNFAFCNVALFTYSRLHNNEVRGYPNGNFGYFGSYEYWGDCSALLHFERIKAAT